MDMSLLLLDSQSRKGNKQHPYLIGINDLKQTTPGGTVADPPESN